MESVLPAPSANPEAPTKDTSPTHLMPAVDHRVPDQSNPQTNREAEKRTISLCANNFRVRVPFGIIYSYDVAISPSTCPQSLKRKIIDTMVSAYKRIFQTAQFVYDEDRNLYTWEVLPIGQEEMDLIVTVSDGAEDLTFNVSVRFLGEVNLISFQKALKSKAPQVSDDALQILSAFMKHVKVYTTLPRSVFSQPGKFQTIIGGGMDVCIKHQTVAPCRWTVSLGINESTIATQKAQSVLELMNEVLEVPDITTQTCPLDETQIAKFKAAIKGVTVKISLLGTRTRRYKICDVSENPAHTQITRYALPSGEFVESSVVDYYLKRYQLELKYPHLPCLRVLPAQLNKYIPVEVCNIVESQRRVIELTVQQPAAGEEVSQRLIMETTEMVNDEGDQPNVKANPCLKGCDITIEPKVMQVSGRVISAPTLMFGGLDKTEVVPQDGAWDMKDKQFYESTEIKEWGIICFAPEEVVEADTLKAFAQHLQCMGQELGITFPTEPVFFKYATTREEVEPTFRYLKNTFSALQLVCVVLHGKNTLYAEVKRVGDICLGLVTQCVQWTFVNTIKPTVLKGICMKINAKLGGHNSVLLPTSRPSVFQEPVIIIGADVTYSSKPGSRFYTVAAAVGSVDGYPSKYVAAVRVQKEHTEKIDDFSSMVKYLLLEFYTANNVKPSRIILYRDGVSESQFHMVTKYELEAVRQACKSLEEFYNPGITLMVLQKRLNTRFYCENGQGETGQCQNVPPGTTVGEGDTHSTIRNFFQCSHLSSTGLSRPCQYHVLWDDNKINTEELQTLTYYLCHTLCRSTKAARLPAPVVYAHLAAARGRAHLTEIERRIAESERPLEEVTDEEIAREVSLHVDVCKGMYFV